MPPFGQITNKYGETITVDVNDDGSIDIADVELDAEQARLLLTILNHALGETEKKKRNGGLRTISTTRDG